MYNENVTLIISKSSQRDKHEIQRDLKNTFFGKKYLFTFHITYDWIMHGNYEEISENICLNSSNIRI